MEKTSTARRVVMNKKELEVTMCYPTLASLGSMDTECKIDMTFFILFSLPFNNTKDIHKKQRQKGLSPPTASGRINFNKGWENVAFDLI